MVFFLTAHNGVGFGQLVGAGGQVDSCRHKLYQVTKIQVANRVNALQCTLSVLSLKSVSPHCWENFHFSARMFSSTAVKNT